MQLKQASQNINQEFFIKPEKYKTLYKQSIQKPEHFWGTVAADELEWFKPWDSVFTWNKPSYTWFSGGKLNITHNCLDRHITHGLGDKTAYIYTNESNKESKITYQELLKQVNKLANGLKSLGVHRGDRVAIYMPLTIESVIAMLACARIGAVHTVVFAGFGQAALKFRIEDVQAKIVITTTSTTRRGEKKGLKHTVDEAVSDLKFVQNVIVYQQKGDQIELLPRDIDFATLLNNQSEVCPPEIMDTNDPLFILYTSGTTGKPKGIVHTVGGYSVYTHYTTKTVFNLTPNDIYWCTADIGWITGHSYGVYGPLSVGITSLITEGVPDYPDPGNWWSKIDRYHVTVFYTAPTVIRMFMKYGEAYPARYTLSSLKILGSVGEPINPEAWQWYFKNIGKEKATIVDTWWQTETGGHAIVTLPSLPQKPGKAGLPFFGIDADVVDKQGNPVPPDTIGSLVIKKPWPGAFQTCWQDPDRFSQYWQTIKNYYYPGDLATKDEDGYIQILGRSDDVLKVAGHRIGTAEVESALVSHLSVAEAAVIGLPDEIKGERIKAFVILKQDVQVDGLATTLKNHVKNVLGSMASPSDIEFVNKLPKTRSGKIMRRVLKAQEMGMDTGDTSTLEE